MVRALLVVALVSAVVSYVVDPLRDAGQYVVIVALALAGGLAIARRPRVAAAIACVLVPIVVYQPLAALVVWPLLLWAIVVVAWYVAARVFAPSPAMYVSRRE
jgi:hypothetical protein